VNNGYVSATNVTLNDIPGGVGLTGVTITPSSIASLAVGATGMFVVSGTASTGGVVTNNATVSCSNGPTSAVSNTVSSLVSSPPTPSLSTPVKIGPVSSVQGSVVSYTVYVTNTGTAAATNVTVNDTPGGVGLVGVTVTPSSIASVAAGQTVSFVVSGVVTAPGTLTNTCTVSASNAPTSSVSNTVSSIIYGSAVNFGPTTIGSVSNVTYTAPGDQTISPWCNVRRVQVTFQGRVSIAHGGGGQSVVNVNLVPTFLINGVATPFSGVAYQVVSVSHPVVPTAYTESRHYNKVYYVDLNGGDVLTVGGSYSASGSSASGDVTVAHSATEILVVPVG
jgi:uncharacterized repeat protein (TIGR01451 family)